MVRPFKSPSRSIVTFSNGTELGTIADGKGHRIFNIEKGMFTHMMSDNTPIGTTTYTENGDIISVVGKRVEEEETRFYNIITHTHINVFANGILTSTGLNNIYPIVGMKFVKEDRTPRSKEEFNVPDEIFQGMRLAEQPLSYEGLEKKIAHLVKRQM
jgi:hypothetical protein